MLERTSWRGEGYDDEAVLREAAHWVRKINSVPLSLQEKKALEAWLRADVRHAGAMDVTMAAWARSPQILAGMGYQASTASTAPSGTRRILTFGVLGSATAALVAVFVSFAPSKDDFAVVNAGAEGRLIELADGSVVELSPGSTIEYRIDGKARHVILSDGSAFFDVKPSPVEFKVDAGNLGIVVTGTQFSVDRLSQRTDIELLEGTVQVNVGNRKRTTLQAGDTASYSITTYELSVTRREVVSASNQRSWPAKPIAKDSSKIDSLRATKDEIAFRNRPLADVIAEVEVESGISISLISPEIASVPLSGTLRHGHLAEDLETIVKNNGFVVERNGKNYVIMRNRNR